ncbi:FimV/HubP family polar landmark protein [Methylomonas koyamae]|uniref:FimV/HubP family polar landmark protein n=1 Tax=Methylomonas koyamae TaxID=702114 RepID=UPI00112D9E89|nr:FimV/HubP family polar landmark protein [Methylomonas koyamae]
MSNLTKALAVVSLLAPVNALPLGIGEIQLHSALNQHLNAEIKLTVDPSENPSDVSVRLAPPEKFDQAGVVWNYFLSKIRFEPVVQANGSILVKITSREVLTEPFLDFLLEVTWPQGSMTREFTLLIDPPTAYNKATIPVVQSPSYSEEPLEIPPRPARKSRTAPRRAVAAEPGDSANQQIATDGEYGPIQKTDTLWSVAARLGQERNVPTYQMLNALHRANPEAFNNGNINSLKEGALLKIPNLEPGQQPLRAESKPAAKQAKTEPAATEKVAKPLELIAPSEAKLGTNTAIGEKAKSGSHSTAPHAGAESAAEASGDGKDLELQARIEKLEQQLNMMQQLLALKDQQLASLQNNKQTPAQAETVPSPAPAPAPAQTAPAVTPPAKAEPSQTQAPTPAPAPAPTAEQPAPQPAPPPAPKPVIKVAPPAPAPAAEEEGLFSSDAYYWVIGGLGSGVLGLLGWLLWRKRNIDERINTESMFASASQIQMPDSESSLSVPIMDISNTSEYDVGTVGESSFISDFTPSDFDAFDTDQNEVDPISEADVYLAYGRYQQAEELIRHAIQEQPNRDECKLKLLEIFYASENKDAFCAYARELADAGKKADKPFWKKIADMAKEIAADSPLFAAEADHSSAAVAAVAVNESFEPTFVTAPSTEAETATLEDDSVFALLDNELADLDLDLDKNLELDDNGLDFDLGEFDSGAKSKTPDLKSVSLDHAAPADRDEPTVDDKHIESFDFNLDFAAPGVDEKPQSAAVSDDLALETIEFSSIADDEPQTADSSSVANASIDSFDFNFELEAPKTAKSEQVADNGLASAEESTLEIEGFDFSDVVTEVTQAEPAAAEPVVADIESFDFNFDADLAAAELASTAHKADSPLNLESELKLETFDFSDFDSLSPKPAETSDTAKSDAIDDFNFEFDFDAPIISSGSDDKFEVGVSDLTDMDEYETKIDLAKAYIDMGDLDAAKTIAEDVLAKGSKQQQQVAQALLDELK